MRRARFGLHDLLYYGEVVGVLVAWVVGVAVVMAAGSAESPVAETERIADASSLGVDAVAD